MSTHQEVHSRPKGTSLWDGPWRKHREKTFFNKTRMARNARVERRKGARRKGTRRKNVSRL